MDLGLAGRCYIVTGASRGLGFAAAQVLVDEGANVVMIARNPDTLDHAIDTLGRERATAFSADIASETTAQRAADTALERFGRLDGALISAGSPTPGTPMGASDDDWRLAFETVFLGGLRVARSTIAAASPATGNAGTGLSIVVVLSTSVRSPIPGLVLSNGLRPGLAMLVKDLADEVGPQGVRVNGVLPGRIATDNVHSQDARAGDPETVRKKHEARIPLRRYGQPEEFGRIAAFLLSPAASYITGSMIAVDGGLLRAI